MRPFRGRGGAVSEGGGAISEAALAGAIVGAAAISGGDGSGAEAATPLVRTSGSVLSSDGVRALVALVCGVAVGSGSDGAGETAAAGSAVGCTSWDSIN